MIGILLTNLGTPNAPTTTAVRRYLAEFLSDPRVVEIPKLLWWPILHGIVLRLRPRHSAKLYQKIWTPDGSPLLIYSQNLARKLNLYFAQPQFEILRDVATRDGMQRRGQEVRSRKTQTVAAQDNFIVALGMRYGEPSIAQALAELKKHNIQQLIVLPLYPQYAAATVGSTFDAVTNTLKTWRHIPNVHFFSQYYQEPDYIAAIAQSIRNHQQQHGQNSYLLFSFHGLPKRSIKLGDPYQQQCYETAQAIADALQLPQDQWSVVFQSRFGRAEWLQPYCDKTLCELPKKGIKNVCVICPGFAVDCLETLEEINQLNRELFLQAGGEVFNYIPALNDSELQVEMLAGLINKHLN